MWVTPTASCWQTHVDQMLARVFARLEEKLDDLGLDLVVGDSRQEEP
jgi:hypothetical protein